MQMNDALVLVRVKFLQEQGRQAQDTDTAEQYEQALADYPATMQIAHVYWGLEFAGLTKGSQGA